MITETARNLRKAKRYYPALRDRMFEAGWTSRDLAPIVGISEQTLSHRLCGRSSWTQRGIESIADELGLTFEEIGRMFFYKRGQDQWLRSNQETT